MESIRSFFYTIFGLLMVAGMACLYIGWKKPETFRFLFKAHTSKNNVVGAFGAAVPILAVMTFNLEPETVVSAEQIQERQARVEAKASAKAQAKEERIAENVAREVRNKAKREKKDADRAEEQKQRVAQAKARVITRLKNEEVAKEAAKEETAQRTRQNIEVAQSEENEPIDLSGQTGLDFTERTSPFGKGKLWDMSSLIQCTSYEEVIAKIGSPTTDNTQQYGWARWERDDAEMQIDFKKDDLGQGRGAIRSFEINFKPSSGQAFPTNESALDICNLPHKVKQEQGKPRYYILLKRAGEESDFLIDESSQFSLNKPCFEIVVVRLTYQ